MRKNTAGQVIDFQLIVRADGTDAGAGLSPTVNVAKDGGAFAPGGGAIAHAGDGCYRYSIPTAETDADHIAFQCVEATVLTVLLNVYTLSDQFSKFDHSSDVVITDAASRTASQADVSGLATQVELDKVIKSGETSTWASSLGSKNDVTVTRNP